MSWTAGRRCCDGAFCIWGRRGRSAYNGVAMITGKILKYRNWPDRLIRFAKHAAEQLEAEGLERETILDQLDAARAQPHAHLNHPVLGELAREWLRQNPADSSEANESLRERPLPYRVWGPEYIDAGAIAQMDS